MSTNPEAKPPPLPGPILPAAGEPATTPGTPGPRSTALGLIEQITSRPEQARQFLEKITDLSFDQWRDMAQVLIKRDSQLQWAWGLWWHGGFKHGERAALVESDAWGGPRYGTLMNYGVVVKRFLLDVEPQISRRSELLPFSYYVALAPLSDGDASKLLERCLLGQIRSVRALEAEIAKLKAQLPATAPAAAAPTRESRLAAAKQALEDKNQVFIKDSIKEIARHGGDELAEAILLHEVQISVEQIHRLAGRQADLPALAPQILAAKRFPLEPVPFTPIGLPTDQGGSNQKTDYRAEAAQQTSAGVDLGDISFDMAPASDETGGPVAASDETGGPVAASDERAGGNVFPPGQYEKRSPEAAVAAGHLARVCSPAWAETLADPAKISDADVIAWAGQSEEHVVKISRLALSMSVRSAIKFVTNELGSSTRLWDIHRRRIADGGRFAFDLDGFHHVVTYTAKGEPGESDDLGTIPLGTAQCARERPGR